MSSELVNSELIMDKKHISYMTFMRTSSSGHSVFSLCLGKQKRGLKSLNRIILDPKEIMSYIDWDRISK